MNLNQLIDYNRVFERIPEITNLPLIRKGRHWFGKCYLSGQPHERLDKLCITLIKGKVLLTEQGGDTMGIAKWLVDFGGCNKHSEEKANYRDAFDLLRECKPCSYVHYDYTAVRDNRFVAEEDITRTSAPFTHSPLFLWLSSIFGEAQVRAAFKRYRVTSDKYNNTVWWYQNRAGQVLHDKRMKYLSNGKRDKDSKFSQSRWFKTDKGYTGQCYFGAHLLGQGEVSLVESEKTALICYLRYGGVWLATGGASNLREVEPSWKVYADYDGAGRKWEDRLGEQCVRWYDESCGEGEDLGDMVLRELIKE